MFNVGVAFGAPSEELNDDPEMAQVNKEQEVGLIQDSPGRRAVYMCTHRLELSSTVSFGVTRYQHQDPDSEH